MARARAVKPPKRGAAKAKAKPKAKAKASAKPRAAKQPTRRKAKPVVVAREPGLEAAIIEAPLDPVPRMIYGDWLQGIGEKRGEWVTLQSGVEAEPDNARLRAAAVEFLDNHRVALLGGGAPMLAAGWIGWRGGFIDELRVQPYERASATLPAFEALLAHPTCRFVRYVTLGALPDPQAYIDALAAAAPPLLEGLSMFDSRSNVMEKPDLDDEAFDSLRRFSLNHVLRSREMPRLVELFVRLDEDNAQWIRQPFPELVELTLDCGRTGWISDAFVVGILRLPALKRLRFVNVRRADELARAIAPHVGRLEVLDISHADLTDIGAAQFFGAPRLELIAMRTEVSREMTRQLSKQVARVAVSNPSSLSIEYTTDEQGTTWLSHRLRTEGRDAIRLVPAAGIAINYSGVNHTNNDRDELASPLLVAAVSLPAPELHTWPWASAAYSFERLGRYDDCELIAREGLLHAPRETNFYAFILYSLRKTGRSADAIRLVSRVNAALKHAKSERQTNGARACLISVMTTLAQAGRHEHALELYEVHRSVADPNAHSVAAMSLLALRKKTAAKAALKRASKVKKGDDFTLQPRRRASFLHAKAVFDLAADNPAEALIALAKAKADRYYDWHWIASDPNLAALHDTREFQELISTPPPPLPKN